MLLIHGCGGDCCGETRFGLDGNFKHGLRLGFDPIIEPILMSVFEAGYGFVACPIIALVSASAVDNGLSFGGDSIIPLVFASAIVVGLRLVGEFIVSPFIPISPRSWIGTEVDLSIDPVVDSVFMLKVGDGLWRSTDPMIGPMLKSGSCPGGKLSVPPIFAVIFLSGIEAEIEFMADPIVGPMVTPSIASEPRLICRNLVL